jgi:hypothetical protein
MVLGPGDMDWDPPFDKFAIPDRDGQMYQTMIAIARINDNTENAKD